MHGQQYIKNSFLLSPTNRRIVQVMV